MKEKYFDEVKQFYIKKLELIAKIEKPERNDYYNFYMAIGTLVDDKWEYESNEYLLYNSITEDKFSDYEKHTIMNNLIEFVKELEK